LTSQTGRSIEVNKNKIAGTTAQTKDELVLSTVAVLRRADLCVGCAATEAMGLK
jgi:hypothetical protein